LILGTVWGVGFGGAVGLRWRGGGGILVGWGAGGILERWSGRSRCGQALLREGCELVV